MTPERLLHIHLEECGLHVSVMADALDEARKWLPFTAESVQDISKAQRRVLDQLAYRFTKLQDAVGQKVLPAILELAQEPIAPDATFAEKLNWLERMGVLPSAEEWKELRVARNAIAHEYPDDPELRAGALNHFVDDAARLNATHACVATYVREHFPNVESATR